MQQASVLRFEHQQKAIQGLLTSASKQYLLALADCPVGNVV